MNRIWLVLLGAVATMTFALTLLVIVPQVLLVKVPPGPGLKPYTERQLAGRQVYVSEGCVYCHSQQVRDSAISTDQARGWGRPSVPADYVYDFPHLLGTMRTGPDLINVGARLPDRNWHLVHLYQPRAVVPWSIMPASPYMFEEKAAAGPGEEAVQVPAGFAPAGRVVIAREEAQALVDYLLSLNRTYPVPSGFAPAGSSRSTGTMP